MCGHAPSPWAHSSKAERTQASRAASAALERASPAIFRDVRPTQAFARVGSAALSTTLRAGVPCTRFVYVYVGLTEDEEGMTFGNVSTRGNVGVPLSLATSGSVP
jgi:hypothetical protein